MKQITFGYALTSGCLKTSTAWTEPLPRPEIGVNHIVLYNVFDKNYEVSTFVNELSKLVNSPHGKINVMITLDAAPFSEMTEAKKLSLPLKHQKACDWINRFPPDDYGLFENTIYELIGSINAKPGNLMQYISWQIGQESDSNKYFHGDFEAFKHWFNFCVAILLTSTDCEIYGFDQTSRKLKSTYRDFVETATYYNHPRIHYSTSFYSENKGVLSGYAFNNYPTRNLPGSAITAYSIGTSTNKPRINSDMWMVRAVQMLQWAYYKQIDYIYFWKLLECKGEDGMYASHTKLPDGGWFTNNVWLMQLQLIDVCKGGYVPTQDGIIGATKKIVITETNYSIVNK